MINSAFRDAENFFVEGDRVDVADVLNFLSSGKFLLAESEDTLLGCVYVEPRTSIATVHQLNPRIAPISDFWLLVLRISSRAWVPYSWMQRKTIAVRSG